ncbi:MAG: Ldh family oxidoreductase [Bacillota bacterium]
MGPPPYGEQRDTRPRVEPGAVEDFVTCLFARAGLPEQDATEVSRCFVFVRLRGIASHGVSRVTVYIRRLRLGLVNARLRVRVEQTGLSTAVLDGDNGMGPVVGLAGMRTALDLARQTGVVAVRHSNHFEAGAYYVYDAIRQQCVGVALSNVPPTMAPWGGRGRLLGTNPVAGAVPAGSYLPVVLDMATSVVARGRIILPAQRGESIPEGWALDPTGLPTTDADAALLVYRRCQGVSTGPRLF